MKGSVLGKETPFFVFTTMVEDKYIEVTLAELQQAFISLPDTYKYRADPLRGPIAVQLPQKMIIVGGEIMPSIINDPKTLYFIFDSNLN